jgi:hypothetical protein
VCNQTPTRAKAGNGTHAEHNMACDQSDTAAFDFGGAEAIGNPCWKETTKELENEA